MTRFSFWQRWLLVVSIVISVFGLSMAFFSGTPFFAFFHRPTLLRFAPRAAYALAVSLPDRFVWRVYALFG